MTRRVHHAPGRESNTSRLAADRTTRGAPVSEFDRDIDCEQGRLA